MSDLPIDLDFLLEQSQSNQQVPIESDPISGLDPSSLDKFLNERDPIRALELWVHNVNDDSVKCKNIKLYLSQYIALIDDRVNEQLNVILHHSSFQHLESRWLGLEKLVLSASAFHNVIIRMLDVSWTEVEKDINKASEFDQSALFNLIYNNEFGTPGGQPYGVLLGDFQVSHRLSANHPNDDVNTLRGMAQIAAASFAPFICAASPELFGLDDFSDLSNPIDFDNIFRQQEYMGWRNLRTMEESRFLGISLPRVLMRKPYANYPLNNSSLFFNEDIEYHNSSRYLWGNACFAIGTVLIREFGNVGWFAHIRGAPRDHLGGGLVTDFQALDYGTDSDEVAQKITTQVIITDNKEKVLSDHGFLSLCDCYDTPFAAFLSCPSLHKAKQYNSKSATANAHLGAMLQQVMCASRFAHYIKVMIRDKVGSFTTDLECERMLQRWLNDYTTSRDDLKWEALSRHPLKSARVQVKELPGKPGIYSSIIHLKPHYIVDRLVSELKLTTELNQSSFGTV